MKNIHRLPFPSLLGELVNFGKDKAFEAKVRRVIIKCMERGHEALAARIEYKYMHLLTGNSDLLIATKWALMHSQKRLL